MLRLVQAVDKVHNQTANQASLTLAILKGLLVKISNETYALPMNNVVEIVRSQKMKLNPSMGKQWQL